MTDNKTNNNIYTIDCEADGLNKFYNRQVFPTGNHFDKESRIWSFTICNGKYGTLTFVSKIPNTRVLPGYYRNKKGELCNHTIAYHESMNVVPKNITLSDNTIHQVIEITDYVQFLTKIRDAIEQCPTDIYFKGYGSHDYDRELIEVNLQRWHVNYDPAMFNKFVNVQPKYWKPTFAQIQAGGFVNNQQYMVNGITHNIEDTIELMKYMNGDM